MGTRIYEFGIDDGDEEMLEQPKRGGRRPSRKKHRQKTRKAKKKAKKARRTAPGEGRYHESKVNRRRQRRTDELLDKLEGLAHSGTVVVYEGSTPCVAVRLDELLVVVEWTRELRERVGVMRSDLRRLIRQGRTAREGEE